MKKYNDWPKGTSFPGEWVKPGDEIDEEMYYYFLEVLPPAVMKGGAFAVGEAVRHDDKGEALYNCFRMIGIESPTKYYYMGLMSVRELAEKLGYKMSGR